MLHDSALYKFMIDIDIDALSHLAARNQKSMKTTKLFVVYSDIRYCQWRI